ncbi:hypothetical protein [Streptomyces sp. NPDC090445]|uniref:hypothetical protein n=1 Tax=Streptomyces sp. NPDC090445 TaxID=3365963 RepID=UPI0038240049
MDLKTVSAARDILIDTCMANAGFPQWVPAPDLPQLSGVSAMDSRYGIHRADLAAERGYHPDESVQKAYDEAVSAGAVDTSGADAGTLRQCARQADTRAPQVKTSHVVKAMDAGSFTASKKDPQVLAVFAKWSHCMKGKGFTYETPLDARNDSRFHAPKVVTQLEISTAVADVACRKEHALERTWFAVEAGLQQQAIKREQPALQALKESNAASVATSSSVLRER